MSILFGRRADAEPFTCSVCGWRAIGLGYSPGAGKPIAWLCGDEGCNKRGREVYHMSAKELDRYEERAILEASQECAQPIFTAIVGKLWDHGVRDLNAVDAKMFDTVSKELCSEPEFTRAFSKFLQAFSASLRAQLAGGVAPF